MELILFVGMVVLAVATYRISGRVSRLEQSSSNTQGVAQNGAVSVDASTQIEASSVADKIQPSVVAPASPSQVSIPASVGANAPAAPDFFERFIAWMKEDWILKLGALLLLIGFGWFAVYAFVNEWIGPIGQITIGIVAGAAILGFGWFRAGTFVNQGSVFIVLGSTVMILTLFAGRTVYDFFTPLSALLIMCASSACVALASLRFNVRILASVGVLLAQGAPLFVHPEAPDEIALFSYLLAVTTGALWILLLRGWKEVPLVALVGFASYSAPYIFGGFVFGMFSGKTDAVLMFGYAFAALFLLANVATIIRSQKDEAIDFVSAFLNGILLLAWILAYVPKNWQSLIIATWTVVFLAVAFLAARYTQRRNPFYVYGALGVALLAAATAAELDGAALAIAYTIESVLVVAFTYFVRRDVSATQLASLILLGPAMLSLESIGSNSWRSRGIFHADFFMLLVLACALAWSGWFLRRLSNGVPSVRNLGSAYSIVGSGYAYILIWLALHARTYSATMGGASDYSGAISFGLKDDTATLIALVLYTIAGLASYIYGRLHESRVVRLYGGVLLGFVVFRLLVVEVWDMTIAWRIITFFIIGTLLMSTAFIGRKKVHDVKN